MSLKEEIRLRGCAWRTVSELIGKTLVSVEKQKDPDRIIFTTDAGSKYEMVDPGDYSTVTIDDINGELDWLVGSPILRAEENQSCDENPPGVPVKECQDSFTWTFYRFETAKGGVVIRWYGESNGYYSESVDFIQTA